MAISLELQRIYSSAPVNIPFYEGLVLTHPSWLEPVAIITNTVTEQQKLFNGNLITFMPANFQVELPKRDDLGLVELSINFPIVTRNMMDLITQAETARTPINVSLMIFIDGSDESQLTPVELQLDQIAVTEEAVTGVASRIDLLNKVFPRNIVRAENFPGLYR